MWGCGSQPKGIVVVLQAGAEMSKYIGPIRPIKLPLSSGIEAVAKEQACLNLIPKTQKDGKGPTKYVVSPVHHFGFLKGHRPASLRSIFWRQSSIQVCVFTHGNTS